MLHIAKCRISAGGIGMQLLYHKTSDRTSKACIGGECSAVVQLPITPLYIGTGCEGEHSFKRQALNNSGDNNIQILPIMVLLLKSSSFNLQDLNFLWKPYLTLLTIKNHRHTSSSYLSLTTVSEYVECSYVLRLEPPVTMTTTQMQQILTELGQNTPLKCPVTVPLTDALLKTTAER